ncbi:MAG: bifunctional folylpolyglutamate synthase/dihydrofolate synthase [Hyphomicrobiales bacterium]|nr:bifunctional folylpolyglutamate synthase/dihydrofolate synthase [Hyphomicrobiales bacterium]
MKRSSDVVLQGLLDLHARKLDLSLGRLERLLAALGDPHLRLPPVIHVGGTNGKGSTVAFMRATLEAAGLSVHVHTSPHLVRFHERIRLGRKGAPGELVGEEELVEALERCERVNAGGEISFFEITMAATFLLFARHPADATLLEVGVGGRGDATNVVRTPIATVITSIGLDHQEWLGSTLEEIAREKAGIFKRGAPAIVAPQDYPEAEMVLRREAQRSASKLVLGREDFHIREENGRLVFEDEAGLLDLPLPRLPGRHQHINAATAIATLRSAKLAPISAADFERGLLSAEWPARLQRLTRGKLLSLAPQGSELWLDGGHNPDGGRVLAAAMGDLEQHSPRPLVVIAAMLSTKDTASFLRPFHGLVSELLAVPMAASTAGRPPQEVVEFAREAGLKAEAAQSIEAALERISSRVWDMPPRILLAGSLYFSGEVLEANGTPPQ